MTRYMIASALIDADPWCHALARELDLPDAEHVHVTIRDGTVTAVPMRQASIHDDCVNRWVDAKGETP